MSAPALIELARIQPGEELTLASLFQFYCYDNSGWDGEDVDVNGRFDACEETITDYVRDPAKAAYWIKVEGALAGFAVTEPVDLPDGAIEEFADFFVLKKFRRRGVALEVVRNLVVESRQRWLISVFRDDIEAARFWQSAFVRLPFRSIRPWVDETMPQFNFFIVNEA